MALEKWVLNCMNPYHEKVCKNEYRAYAMELETVHVTDEMGNAETQVRYPKRHFCPKCQNGENTGDRYKY